MSRQALARGLEPLEARQMLSVATDEQGWTVFGRSADTRVVYVSNSAGNDANSGLAEDAPVKTLAKARTLLRNGAPDWMLLKRGDVWNETLTGWNKSGRDADEMMVIGAYGSGARPKLNTGLSNGFGNSGNYVAHVALVGIHFHAHVRDASDPAYNGTTAGGYGFNTTGRMDDVLIEDAVFDDYVYNLSVTGYDQRVSNFRMRRSVVTDAWSIDKAQGIYVSRVDGLLLEGNVFDHNGWNESVTGAHATIFNHSVYMASDNTGVVLRGNVISNSSSHGVQARSGGVIEDNVFLRNPINLLFGGGSPTVKPLGVEGRIRGNVFLDSRSINGSGRGTGIELSNIKAGANVVVSHNIFTADTHRVSAAITFGLTTDAENISESVGLNDLTIRDNIVYDWHSAWNMSETFRLGQTGYRGVNNVRVEGNDFQNTAIGRIVRHGPAVNTSKLYWQSNRYHNALAATGWFQIGSTTTSFNTWKSNVEPTAAQEQVVYAEPGRSVASYNVSLGGDAAFGAFLASVRASDRRSLDGRYTAAALINYVREGFAEAGVVPGGVASTYGAQTADANSPTSPATDPTDTAGPGASLTTAPVTLTSGGAASHTFTVTYTDASAVDLNSLSSSDVRVTGPNGYNQLATIVSKTTSNNGKTVIAVYGIRPNGAYWDAADNGTYTLSLVSGAARDTLGNNSAAAEFGTFLVDVASDTAPPAMSFQPIADITIGGTAPATFTLTYTDETGVDVNTIGTGDVRVTLPDGSVQSAAYVSRQVTNNGKTVVTVYTLDAPGGYWDSADNGSYLYELSDGAVADLLGRTTPAQQMDVFTVDVPWVDSAAPTATVSAPPLTVGGLGPYAFTVTFADETGVDAASVGADDLVVTGPEGQVHPVTLISTQPGDEGRTLAAVFSLAAPDGFWDAADNGAYEIALVAGGVRDVLDHAMGAASLGAFSVNVPPDSAAPAATLSAETVSGAGAVDHTFTITFTDATGVAARLIGDGDINVTGPGGYSAAAQLTGSNASADGKTITATYRVPARGGEWDYFDNGTYSVVLNDGEVQDLLGNAASQQTVGTFAVSILDHVAPVASLAAEDVTTPGGQTYTFSITYEDDIGINLSTVGGGDVLVTAPDGGTQAATFVSKQSTNGGRTVTATYTLAAPGGAWDDADNGEYRVALASAQVADVAGNVTAVGTVGHFTVNVAPPQDTVAPTATLSAADVTTGGGATHAFTITYTDDLAPDPTTIGGDDIVVTGPGGYSEPAALVSTTSGDAKTVVATYSVPAPGGSWDHADNGAYSVGLSDAAVSDRAGNGVDAAALGSFTVNVPPPPDTAAPTATLTVANVTTGGGTSHAFDVAYGDDRALDATTVGAGDLLVTGPNGFSQAAAFVSKQSPDGKTTTATYSIIPPGGSWDAADNGAYQVSVQSGQVLDAGGNAVAAGSIGSFTVNVAGSTPTTVTLGTSTSTYVHDGTNANANYGGSAELQSKRGSGKGNTREAYVRFDIASLTNVTGAKLQLRGALSASGSVPIVVYGSGNTTWSETTLTWNNKPATNTAALAAKTLTSTTYGLHEWDVTAYLQQLKSAGATAVTFVLKGSTNTSPYARFRSDDYATTTERPQLVVTQGPVVPATPSLVVSKTTMSVPEGGTGTFTVALASAPASDMTVTVARQSGDSDLTGAPGSLVFTAANWSTPQTVTIDAAQDADTTAGQATFAVSAPNTTTRTVTATEIDDDVAPAPQPVTIASSVATYVRDGTYAAQNFGTATDLVVKKSANAGNTRETYLRFDLSSVSTIGSAKLRLFGRMSAASTTTPTLTADVYSSTNTTWSETTTTWNTKPATGATKIGSITVGSTTDGWYELDLTAFLKAELAAGRKVFTLALRNSIASDPYLTFASDETTNGPQVVVTP